MYFDYTATTKMDDEVLKTYIEVESKYYANTTSLHLFGQKCNSIYEKMIKEINNILGLENGKVIFTANATEANNLAIQGLIGNKIGKLITTKIEHPSVYEVFKHYEKLGYDVVYLDINDKGIIDLDMLKREMNKDVILVSCMWVNNIVGAIQPIKEVIDIVKEYPKTKLHVDGVQGICKIEMNFDLKKIDAFTISAHKFYGPKGLGMLLAPNTIAFEKILFGSNAQEGIKPGTLDLGLICASAKALKIYYPQTSKHYEEVKKINSLLRDKITNDKIIINSDKECSPYILSISIPNILGETLVHMFEEKEIYVSTGSSCSSKLAKPEKTIFAMTNDEKRAKSLVRISLSHLTTIKEIEFLASVINNI